MKVRNEIKIGLIVVVSLALLYFGLSYLKGSDIFRNSNEYYAIYDQIDGLTTDSKVLLNGVKVGRVAGIKLLPHDSNKISVRMEILESELILPQNSIAMISSLDLLGSKGIILKLSEDTVYCSGGDTLLSELEQDVQSIVEEKLAPIQFQIEELVKETRDAITIVRISLTTINEAVTKADGAIGKIDHATVTIDNMVAVQSVKLGEVLNNISAITANIKNNTENINNILENVAIISDSLTRANYAAAIQNASNALAQIDSLVARINRGEGSIGLLVNDDKLYKSLEQAALEIDKLAEDLRRNPKRYFSPLGKNEKSTMPAKTRDENGRVVPSAKPPE